MSAMARSATVVGAGMVGLSVAWHLQEQGFDVVVLDRGGVGEGSSFANAGWLSPALALPLNDPALVRSGLVGLLSPHAPLYVPPRLDRELARFLAVFLGHCTSESFEELAARLHLLNRGVLESWDELAGAAGLEIGRAPIVAGFAQEADLEGLVSELRIARDHGAAIEWRVREAEELQACSPLLGPRVRVAVEILEQRFIDSHRVALALADAVRARGGEILAGKEVTQVVSGPKGVRVLTRLGEDMLRCDVAVLALGAWTNRFARTLGIEVPLRAGRGYSMLCATTVPPEVPLYFPTARLACTPIEGKLRVAGTMEFRRPDEPLDHGRIAAMQGAAEGLLTSVELARPERVWVGPRPVSADGLPLIGQSRLPGVYVACGHGMWGVTQGPITGKLLARQIATGQVPPELVPFDPLRSAHLAQTPMIAKWLKVGRKP
jgi:D-amino-acid dehydrogenase